MCRYSTLTEFARNPGANGCIMSVCCHRLAVAALVGTLLFRVRMARHVYARGLGALWSGISKACRNRLAGWNPLDAPKTEALLQRSSAKSRFNMRRYRCEAFAL